MAETKDSIEHGEIAIAEEGDDVLPSGWESRVDDKGRTYFVNLVSRTTQWERPTVSAGAMSPGGASTGSGVGGPPPATIAAEGQIAFDARTTQEPFIQQGAPIEGTEAPAVAHPRRATWMNSNGLQEVRRNLPAKGNGCCASFCGGAVPLDTNERCALSKDIVEGSIAASQDTLDKLPELGTQKMWTHHSVYRAPFMDGIIKAFNHDSTYTLAVSKDRLICSQALVKEVYRHPQKLEQTTVWAVPTRYFQCVEMVLADEGHPWIRFLMAAWKYTCAYSPLFVCLFCVLTMAYSWHLPNTLEETSLDPVTGKTYAGIDTEHFIHCITFFAVMYMIYSFVVMYHFVKHLPGFGWNILAAINWGFAFITLILAGAMESATDSYWNYTTSSSNQKATYEDALQCSCPSFDVSATDGPVTASDVGYSFTCSSTNFDVLNDSSACLFDADCGFCGDDFNKPFMGILVMSTIGLLVAIVMLFIFYWAGHWYVAPIKTSPYMLTTLHGIQEYGYPIILHLSVSDAMEVQDHLYQIRELDRTHFADLSICDATLTSSANSSRTVTGAIKGTLYWVYSLLGMLVRFGFHLIGGGAF